MIYYRSILLCVFFFCLMGFAGQNVTQVLPRVMKIITHDNEAFTQGLEYKGGKLYESTGLNGRSSIRVLDTNGNILKKTAIPDIFAEGCTIFGNKLYQLTWKETQCLVYTFPNLIVTNVRTYTGEGWGLTHDTKNLIMSNGSDTIYFRDTTFKMIRKVPVRLQGNPLRNINELEYARNHIFANVWYDDKIYEINPSNGMVLRIIECYSIVQQERPESDQNVLNGIAYIESSDRFFITGKNWKHMYLVNIPRMQ